MTASPLRALALALSVAALAAAAAPGTATAAAAVPPVLTSVNWTLRVSAGSPAGFVAKAIDPDGDEVTLSWAFDDGTAATGRRITKVWTVPGLHTASVTATDATGLSTVRTLTVEVLPPGAAPVAAPPTAGHMSRPGPPPVAHASVRTTALRLTAANAIAVRVRCARGADCAGTVSVARGGRRLAAGGYAIAGGRRATIHLPVAPGAARALRRRPSRSIAVVVTIAPVNGAPVRADAMLRVR